VFLPCYNEAENIARVAGQAIEVLEALADDWELIVVDDGSSDGTGRIAEQLAAAEPRIRLVTHQANGGYGMALRSGFAAATKEYVFYTDGDGQFDMHDLGKLLPLRDKRTIVNGYRRHRQDGLIRRTNAACWSWLVKRVLGFRCRDVDSAFKLYPRELFGRMELRSSGALIDAEVLARATRLGYRIVDVPVRHLPRQAGSQTGARIGVILRAFRELLALRGDITSMR
jgi:glycosyltransferase involved in cell wall biosynthesis